MKICLAVLVKNENIYLKEWIDHYKNIGIDHIYIGDNNFENNEDVLSFIMQNNYNDYVTVLNYKQYQDDYLECLNIFLLDVYQNFGYLYDYFCSFDVDEFLSISKYISQNHNIKDYLTYMENNYDFDQIHIPWIIYDDNNKLFYENKPVQERFKRLSESIEFEDNNDKLSPNNIFDITHKNLIKSIVKTKLNIKPFFTHTWISNTDKKLNTVDCSGILNIDESYTQHITLKIYAVLKHYISKSTEEYFYRRLDSTYKELNNIDKSQKFNFWVENYFRYNLYTPEKQKLINMYKLLYINNIDINEINKI